MKTEILGVKINTETIEETTKLVEHFLVDGKQHYIVTPNPEFLVLAQKDEEFKYILNNADIAVADGFGLTLASRFIFGKKLQRITGNDLVEILARTAEKNNYPIFFLGGGEKGVAKKASEKLLKKFSKMPVAGTMDEKIFNDPKNIDKEVIDAINFSKAKILFVALGQGKQEKFIHYNLPQLNSVALAIGIGGVFDFLAGNKKRAPVFMQRFGLEWLYRLIQEPKRWKRIYNAVIIFPILVFYQKFYKKNH